MTCRPDGRLLLAALAALTLVPPLAAAPGSDPLAAAAAALDRGDGIAAEAAIERALRSGSPREQVSAFAGAAALLEGDLAGARSWLAGERFDPDSAQRGYHALARLEVREGDTAAAARAFDLALAQGAASAPLWVDIGRFRYRNGEHELALAAAEQALAIDLADPRALEYRGQLLRDAEGVRPATEWFARALEKAPDDLGLLGEYAASLAEAGEYRAMLRVARRMVELDPRHPRAYFLQAVLAARAGEDDLARRLLWRTGTDYDGVPAAQLLAGILELRTGSPALAAGQFAALARRQPDNERVRLLLARSLLAAGEANEVVARFGAAAARPEASPYLLTLVGRAYEQLGRRAEAAPLLDRAAGRGVEMIGVMPSAAGAKRPGGGELDAAADAVPLLRSLLAQGHAADALALGAKLGAQHRDSADVARLRGDVALLAATPDEALAHYATAARIRRDRSLVERMVAALRLAGRETEAAALLADHVERNPADAPALALYGRMQAGRGQWQAAAELLGRARALGAGDPRLLASLAQARLAIGDREGARRAAREAYALQPASGLVADGLARSPRAGGPGPRGAAKLLAEARQRALAQR